MLFNTQIFNKNGLLKYYDDPAQFFLIQQYSKIPKNCKILLCLATMQTILLETELYLPNSYIVDIDLSKEIPITTMKIDCDVVRIPTHANGIILSLQQQNGVKNINENRTLLPLNDIIGNLRTIENDDKDEEDVDDGKISTTTSITITTTDNNLNDYINSPTIGDLTTNANEMRRNNYIQNTTMAPWLYNYYYNLRKSASIQPYFNGLHNDSSTGNIDITSVVEMLEPASYSVNNSINSSTNKPNATATLENNTSNSNTNAPDFLNKDSISTPLIVTPPYGKYY